MPEQPLDNGLHSSSLNSLPLHYRGKVRDIYRIDSRHWLIIATDRVSAFDVILPTVIPGKGRLLTELALFWFDRFQSLIPNHLVPWPLAELLPDPDERRQAEGRSMVVRQLDPLPVEAVVRGYLIGSAWTEYQTHGSVCDIALPAGLRQADRLPEVVFTPSTKAAAGEHDENISFAVLSDAVGANRALEVRDISLAIYREAARFAAARGILIADTKFEFGLDDAGRLTLMDEILTPDSSRFWEASRWQPGSSPPSFDKQYVRDYLETLAWDKRAPGPALPAAVIQGTLSRYRDAVDRLSTTRSTRLT